MGGGPVLALRLAAIVVFQGVAGCGPPPATLRAELSAYLAQLQDWAPVEAETARTIERILATEFVDEGLVRQYLAEAIPRTETHVERVRAYRPRTPPVASVHARYAAAWEALLAGFRAIEHGFHDGDWSQLALGRRQMAQWRDGMLDVARELRTLADRYQVPRPSRASSESHRSARRPSRGAPRRGRRKRARGGGPTLVHRTRAPSSVDQAPAASYSPTGRPCSTIGAGGLNGRVRDGNGCFPSAIATGKRFDSPLNGYSCREPTRGSSTQRRFMVKPRGHLVPVSSTPCGASTSGLSTSSSSRGLRGPCGPGMPYLEVGFPLICFQRLSRPHMATRRCGWRHNRNTSGASIPVLSY